MCTFILSDNFDSDAAIIDLKSGGPDLTTITEYRDFSIKHNLLHITGEMTPQPFVTKTYDFFLLGEIYNYTGASELEFLATLYLEHQEKFIDYIDGEFLIIVVNKENNCADFFSDPWATRQAWRQGNTIATRVRSPELRLEPNKHYRWSSNQLVCLNNAIITWDLNQHKTEFDDIFEKLEQAIVKRWRPNSALLLSGGIDSSVVALVLHKHNLPVTAYSFDFSGTESSDSLEKVRNLATTHTYHYISEMPDDSVLLRWLAKKLNTNNHKVVLTGAELDGVYENYRHKPEIPTMKQFKYFPPTNLNDIFPWEHFEGGRMRYILDNWETQMLHEAVEVRNCFLDRDLVQEFLWLCSYLKNERFKHFLKTYLEAHGLQLDYSNQTRFDEHVKHVFRTNDPN
jgi:hypothetical protein